MAVSLVLAGRTGIFQPGTRPLDPAGYALIAVACLVLVGRRSFPVTTLMSASVAVAAFLSVGYPFGPVLIAVAVAVYTVVSRSPVRRAAVYSGVALLILLSHLVFSDSLLPGLVPASAWVVVPFAVGTAVRLNRLAAERERAAEARRTADDERLRVAREVHDVVGHGLAAIALQADIALHLLPTRPAHAETALAAISVTSREALEELRTTLEVLRGGAGRAPAVGLAQLDALVDRAGASGTPVRTEVTGDVRPLPPAVDLVAYRVVQESLTNVLRHAGPAVATVRVDYGAGSVRLEVTDTGVGGPCTEGHGLTGMRERVVSVGGTLSVSGAAGFHVVAVLPAP